MPHRAKNNEQPRSLNTNNTIRYHVEMLNGKLAIRPMTEEEKQAYAAMTPGERVKKFLEWANQPRPETPILPDEAFRRENLYD